MDMVRRVPLAIIVAPLMLSSICFACRPLNSEDYGVQDKGTWSLESGIQLMTNRDNSGTNTIDDCLHYGVWDHVEVAVDMPYLSFISKHISESGLGDGTLCVKYNFISFSDEEGMTLKFSYLINSGDPDKGLGSNENDMTTTLVLTKRFGDYTCHFNVGYLFDNEPKGTEIDDHIIYNVAVQRPLNDKTNMCFEMTSQLPTVASEDEKGNAEKESVIEGMVGLTNSISDTVVWDIGAGGGFNRFSSDSNFTTGLTVNF